MFQLVCWDWLQGGGAVGQAPPYSLLVESYRPVGREKVGKNHQRADRCGGVCSVPSSMNKSIVWYKVFLVKCASPQSTHPSTGGTSRLCCSGEIFTWIWLGEICK